MKERNDTEFDPIGLDRVLSFVKSSSLFYSAMAGIGSLVCFYMHRNLIQLFSLPAELNRSLVLLALGLMGALVLLIASYLFEDQFPSYRAFRQVLMRMVGPASIPVAIYLAFISALGEELLFRGALQPVLGLWGTALLFGLLHLGPQGAVSIWTLWAVLSGVLLGWMFESTGSLWPVLICHFLVNVTSLLRLRYQYQRFRASHSEKLAQGRS